VRAGWRQAAGRTTGPVIVSSSRAILYAGADQDFPAAARRAAQAARQELALARI
jgi:orotidine-5'-phosphate decarboxylase